MYRSVVREERGGGGVYSSVVREKGVGCTAVW